VKRGKGEKGKKGKREKGKKGKREREREGERRGRGEIPSFGKCRLQRNWRNQNPKFECCSSCQLANFPT
jgi:hypothetical protein